MILKTDEELNAMAPHMRDAWIVAELIAAVNAARRLTLIDALRGQA